MIEQTKLSLVAIAVATGSSVEDAWTIVDALPEMSEREASRAVAAEVTSRQWGTQYAN